MKNKLLAFIITVAMPIWIIPFVLWLWTTTIYGAILEWLQAKERNKKELKGKHEE